MLFDLYEGWLLQITTNNFVSLFLAPNTLSPFLHSFISFSQISSVYAHTRYTPKHQTFIIIMQNEMCLSIFKHYSRQVSQSVSPHSNSNSSRHRHSNIHTIHAMCANFVYKINKFDAQIDTVATNFPCNNEYNLENCANTILKCSIKVLTTLIICEMCF